MSKQNGPRVHIEASCFGCAHVTSEHYAVQGDSGSDVYCSHPDVVSTSRVQSNGFVGDTTWKTPSWCPLLKSAIDSLLKKQS